MTKAELVNAIADGAKLTKSQARDALEAFVGAVTTSLKSGTEVRLVGFGSFVPVERKAGPCAQPSHRRDGQAPPPRRPRASASAKA